MTNNNSAAGKLSVLVLTRNRLALLKRCLHALEQQTAPPEEVVVVDTGSTDGTREWLKEQGGAFSFALAVQHQESGSFAEARNAAVEAASGDLIGFLDDDCEATGDWAERMRSGLSEYDALGGVAISGEFLVFPRWWHPEMNWLIGLSGPGLFNASSGAFDYPSTSNLSVRRTVFKQIKFQELRNNFKSGSLYEGGREDAQFWREVRRAGFRTQIDPKCVALHHFGHDRFGKRQLIRRALADGRAFWRRERQESYLDQAVRDLLTTNLCWIGRLFAVDNEGAFAEMACSYSWSLRQLGFLMAYSSSPPRLKHFARALSAIVRLTPRVAIDQAKRPLRHISLVLRRRSRGMPQVRRAPRRLLVACFGFLGDTVIVEPACRAFKKANPQCEMTLLTHPMGENLHSSTGIWDRIITTDQKSQTSNLPSETDAVLIPYFHGQGRADGRMLDALTKMGPCVTFQGDVGFRRRRFYDWCAKRVEKNYAQNEILNIAALFRTVGNLAPIQPYCWTFSAEEQQDALALTKLSANNFQKAVAVHFGSEIDNKLWPLERWQKLCRRIITELQRPVVLVGSAKNKTAGERLVGELPRQAVNVCGRTTARQLGALLSQAALVVTGDSGPKHLAFACDAPTVSLYGPSDERRWGAHWKRERHRFSLGGNFDLTPEEMHGLPENYLMNNIKTDDVFNLIAKALANAEN